MMKLRNEGAGITLAMILVIVGVSAVLAALQRSVEGKPYDERQIHARGVAGQWGFFTMVGFGMGSWLLLELFETELSYELALRMTALAGIGVYSTVAVWKDAYVAMTERWETVLLWLGLLTAFRWIHFLGELDRFSLSLGDTESWTNLLYMLLFTWITGLLAVKCLIRRREEKNGD